MPTPVASTSIPTTARRFSQRWELPRLTPLASAIAVLAIAGSLAGTDARAQPRPFSSGWLAAKGAAQAQGAATGKLPNGMLAGVNSAARQQQQARQQLGRSVTNLGTAAAAIAAQQAVQLAARAAAQNDASVPDGLAEGGLKMDADPLTAGWINARVPVQTQGDARTTVVVEQTGDKAILNWETFNVGRNTTVDFKQQADWAVLNRVNDPHARPSQIQGQIKADGTVMIVNANGVVFSGSSQVNVRNLAAAAAKISDTQFNSGLYGANDAATFSGAAGKVLVEQGAQIHAAQAANSVTGGGYVLLAGKEVHNAGTIAAPKGQTALAAGDSFVIRRGQGSGGNQQSTTRGSEIIAQFAAGSTAGAVSNTGLITAATGDITLTGNDVKQAGVALASTSVNNRGTVHLDAGGENASVTLAEGATTAILLDESATALDSQRDSLLAPVQDRAGDILPGDKYRRDLSLVEIKSAGTVDFRNGSITLATGGQVAVDAAERTLVRDGSIIDVSGAIGVQVAMESNSIKINVQGNEMRDAPVNRDSNPKGNNSHLSSTDIWVDVRELVFVPAGTDGYASDRWYTAGGLLEVGGYLGTEPRGAGKWMAQGGTVSFSGNEVVTQAGSQINVSGGTLDVQDGFIRQSWLRGADNRLYEISRAPADILYSGLYRGYEAHSARWDVTRNFYNPLLGPRQRFEQGYTVGRDAGRLSVGTRNAVLEGGIVGDTYQGARQVEAAQAGLEGYYQAQNAVARGGQLIVGSYTPYYVKDSGTLQYRLMPTDQAVQHIVLGNTAEKIAAGLALDTPLPEERGGTLYLDTGLLNDVKLGSVKVAATAGITVQSGLTVGHGGEITLYAPQVDINADLVSRGGRIQAGNVLNQVNGTRYDNVALAPASGQASRLNIVEGVRLDASGLLSNGVDRPDDMSGVAYRNGGNVSLRGTGDVHVAEGSVIDVSSGAALMRDRSLRAGRGGDVTLAANVRSDKSLPGGSLAMAGAVKGYGMSGGGTLSVTSGGKIVLGAAGGTDAGKALVLDPALFQQGFAHYEVNGHGGVEVADGAHIVAQMPVYRYETHAGQAPSEALSLWMPPLYQTDLLRGVLTRRQGAALSLTSNRNGVGETIRVGQGARVEVDPGQAISLVGGGQITVEGRLQAPGGRIFIDDTRLDAQAFNGGAHAQSVWIGEQAVLDVSGRSAVALDREGRRYGQVLAGGQIEIGGTLDWEAGDYRTDRAMDRHIIIRPGALLDASGAQAVLDLPGRGATTVASDGGGIVLVSASSLSLDGALRAAAGGEGAAGGTLGLSLNGSAYYTRNTVDAAALAPRILTLAQTHGDSLLAAGLRPGVIDGGPVYGSARLGVDRIEAGGFGNLAIDAAVRVEGDLDLGLSQSLRFSGAIGMHDDAPDGSLVRLHAAYIRFDQATYEPLAGGDFYGRPAGSLLDWTKRNHRISVQADLLDVRGVWDFRNFDDVSLSSRGDVRLMTSVDNSTGGTQLLAPQRMTLTAAQIYPVTGAQARIAAGYYYAAQDSLNNPDATLILRRPDGELPPVPYSAFGYLRVHAPSIEQGTVLRAPLGFIEIGATELIDSTSSVRFLPGSLTSVSGAGLVMPYGGTADGINYQYGGANIEPTPAGGNHNNPRYRRMLAINGNSIEVEPGAVLDMDGGGDLRGAGFVSGRGGSVDILKHALEDGNPAAFRQVGNGVYAIVPSFSGAYAPIVAESGAGAPAVGQQVTIEQSLPGLPAGTYTLLPSTYALLPGAFRVEIGAMSAARSVAPARTRAGSWATRGYLGTANVGQRNVMGNRLLVMPADVLRRHAQYNETSYAEFLLADAARRGIPRAMLPMDASQLNISLRAGAGMGDTPALRVEGEARFRPAPGSRGFGGTLSVSGPAGGIEVLARGQAPISGADAAAVSADALTRLRPSRLVMGSVQGGAYGSGAQVVSGSSLLLRSGATLSAPEILLGGAADGSITVEQGATLTTLGMGPVSMDARNGYYLNTTSSGVLAVSNGYVTLVPPLYSNATQIDLGVCLASCQGATRIVSEGTIGVATNGVFSLGETVEYGTRNLLLSVSSLNLGSAQALAEAQGAGHLPPGMALRQDVLDSLLRGNTALGTPALESLILAAGESVNIFGEVMLDTRGASGAPSLRRLVLGAPAIYGYGSAGDAATIIANEFVWAGTLAADRASNVPGYATPAAPGGVLVDQLGDGSLAISADVIRFDAAPYATASSLVPAERLVLGFSSLTLDASRMVTGAGHGMLAIHHQLDGQHADGSWRYRGGDLLVRTPMLTGEAGASLDMRAGGVLTVQGTGAAPGSTGALGATLSLAAQRLALDSAVVLPSGRLTLEAKEDIVLGNAARIDLSGREVEMMDVKRYSPGGDLVMQSFDGNITQLAGSVIDLSARNNRGGRLQAIALGGGAGRLELAGAILGSASGIYNAGGTLVPYDSAEVTLRAQALVDFARVNARLTEGGVFGARRFQVKQGDLVVGDEVRARHVEIVADGGDLTVNGRIDASGMQAGSIRLAAQGDLLVQGMLDAHATGLRVDSYRQIVESSNRAIVDLTSRSGTLTLGLGAAVDLRAGTDLAGFDGRAMGTLDLNARRLGGGSERGALAGAGNGANDVAVNVVGSPAIRGAKTVAVNAFRRYDDAPPAAQPDVTGKTPQLISQSYLNGIDGESIAFMDAALGNAGLRTRLAGLGDYRLRPGVEIVSATPDGDLTVDGDLDLSGYRYGPGANRTDPALRGFGEPGMLVLRAGGNLNIHGSINDGFAPPPDTPDDDGWWLIEGRYSDRVGQTPFGGDLVVPIDGVTLEAGTTFMPGAMLNYDLPANATTLPAGTLLPVAVTLNGDLSLPAGLVLTGEVTMADGSVLPAGTVLKGTLGLTAGARLGAGFRLRTAAAVQAFTWPKGVQLPVELVASGPMALARGSLIPAQTKVELLGDAPIRLRAAGAGRNWALAPMLGEGASSWSLTAVAGADLGSADVRARNTLGSGDIVLADTHYGMLGKATTRYEGGGGGGPMILTPDGALGIIGDSAVAGMTQDEISEWLLGNWGGDWAYFFGDLSLESMCAWDPGYCVAMPSKPILTADGALGIIGDPAVAGMTQDEISRWLLGNWGGDWAYFFGDLPLESMCTWDPGYCITEGATPPTEITEYHYSLGAPAFSVLRTGTGDLALLAGRDVGMMSVYGVYTAGTPTALGTDDALYNLARGTIKEGGVLGKMQGSGDYDAALAAYQAWYPDHGGNLTVSAGRDVYGDVWGDNAQNGYTSSSADKDWSRNASSAVGNWLWRQGNHGTPGVEDIAASWWINFGTYVNNFMRADGQPRIVGFTGFGTLGGGNLSISAERHAGVRDARGDALRGMDDASPRSQGLVAAVGSTGRVVGGELVLTGGGDLDLRVGGDLNPTLRATQQGNGTGGQGGAHRLAGGALDHLDLNGVLTNLRGNLTLSAGQVGGIAVTYGDGGGLRASDPFAVGGGLAMGGPVLMLGDATAWLDTRSDLVLGGASDPGRTRQLNSNPYRLVGAAEAETGGGESWFSLWTPDTAVSLFSAGGDVTPITAHNSLNRGSNLWTEHEQYFVYPSILRAVAAQGNIILPMVPSGVSQTSTLLLAPSRSGELDMLAGGSILAHHAPAVSLSGADTPVASPLRPAFTLGTLYSADYPITNVSREAVMSASGDARSLFAFGPNTPLDIALHAGHGTSARFYAVEGDIVGLRTGGITPTRGNGNYVPAIDRWVEAAVPVSVRAGQDILGLTSVALHNNATDVSLVRAARDIVHADLMVAGPGTVVLQAGRQLRQEDRASVRSIGGLVRGDMRPGASIAVLAGVGAAGPDYNGFLARYLSSANLMESGRGLDIQPHRVAQVYEGELTLSDWLRDEYGYTGPEAQASQELVRLQALRDADPTQSRRDLSQDYRQESELHLVNWLRTYQGYAGDEASALEALAGLAPEQRDIYARQLYFAELRKGGREYNDADGPRFGSYLRGRRAIAALFPEQDAHAAAIRYEGDFTMYGGSGLRTDFGGGIQVLTPGGQQVHGVEGAAPPSTAGVVTQGQGDIQMYSLGSILLGQSRIMTTFGGHIQAWSAQGDINAGRGSKTTVVYTPPRRVYDQWGNVTLSPVAPSTGAGIATLNPIAEVAPGDIDLVAPLGTIDAGEAGIRVSGNINIAALQVVNAANIQVQGESVGMPVVASVNTGALSSASAASASAAVAAQDTVSRARNEARQNQPSIFSVQILGFGGESLSGAAGAPGATGTGPSVSDQEVSYRPDHMVQIIGRGDLSASQASALSADERQHLGL